MARRMWPALAALLLPLQAAAASPVRVPSKIEQVLLYSTEARVFRAASLTVGGEPLTASVADLPSSVQEDSVRVECKSADVQRVEIARTREPLPEQVKARELVEKIEAELDGLRATLEERRLLEKELELMSSLRLQRPPSRPGERPPVEGLFVEAWRGILRWVEARSLKLQARQLSLSREQRKAEGVLHGLFVQSQEIDLRFGEAVPRVLVTLKGRPGKHRVLVSYLVTSVRWVPTYDLGYDHRSRSVEAATYALVSQSTGEDWPAAELLFSTGRPTHLITIPELPTWTLGRQRDFEPRPRPRPEPSAAAWSPPPIAADAKADPTGERLRQALVEFQSLGYQPAGTKSAPKTGERSRSITDHKIIPVSDKDDSRDTTVEGDLARPRPSMPAGMAAQAPPPSPPPAEAPEMASVTVAARRSGSYAVTKPTEQVPWTEEGYRPPPIDRDSPAAAAEGYLYTIYAPGRHSIRTTGTPQRVPLTRQRLGITPVYRIRPALAPAAYLTATLVNTTGKPILRGAANLFTGSMYTGRTWINTALPGRKIVLSLGVDDSVQVVRHLRQKTATEGVLFKDDATSYTVAIELANHRRHAVQVELEDQVPVKEGQKIEVKAFSSSSFGKPDDRGRVLWKGWVPASSVKKLEFSFQLVRPKDWELQQHDD